MQSLWQWYFCVGTGLSRPTELAVLRACVFDRQGCVRGSFVLEHREHSTAIRRATITASWTILKKKKHLYKK